MKLYVNTVPFAFGWADGEPDFIPVGTTFAAVGADSCGLILKLTNLLNSGDAHPYTQSIPPSLLDYVFKEVEQLNSE